MNSRLQLLLDAGALISAEAHPHGKVIAECQLALLARRPALLPAVVFAQVWRASPRQHALSKIRQMCRVVSFTEHTVEDVGRLLARSRTSDVVDAAVAPPSTQSACSRSEQGACPTRFRGTPPKTGRREQTTDDGHRIGDVESAPLLRYLRNDRNDLMGLYQPAGRCDRMVFLGSPESHGADQLMAAAPGGATDGRPQ